MHTKPHQSQTKSPTRGVLRNLTYRYLQFHEYSSSAQVSILYTRVGYSLRLIINEHPCVRKNKLCVNCLWENHLANELTCISTCVSSVEKGRERILHFNGQPSGSSPPPKARKEEETVKRKLPSPPSETQSKSLASYCTIKGYILHLWPYQQPWSRCGTARDKGSPVDVLWTPTL